MREADDLDEELGRVLIGGREEREVRIEPYSQEWPRRFEEERKRIASTLGATARRIEHVGSIAVPGLAAKPVIEIIVTVEDPEDEGAFVGPLESIGYELRVREPGHRMFRTPARDVHLHIWVPGSEDERRHLLFRDWLRAHPEKRVAYEATKRALAGRWRDTNYYARAKGPFIEGVVERARRAAQEG